MQKEKFRKYLNHPCPDCGYSQLKLVDYIDDEVGVSYAETYTVCEECGFNENITDKRKKNTKIDV